MSFLFDIFPTSLNKFLKAHPKQGESFKATREVLQTYARTVPKPLLNFWKKHGFGVYGLSNFTLVNPLEWQVTLDRWVSPHPEEPDPSGMKRIPILLSALGVLVYYRKHSDGLEDVVSVDPVTKVSQFLSDDLVAFFNKMLVLSSYCETNFSTHLVPMLKSECECLKFGEVYQLDLAMLQLGVLKCQKVGALAEHKTLRDAVDENKGATLALPKLLGEAIPTQFLTEFLNVESKSEYHEGLYVSAYIDWFKLLYLRSDKTYVLLFWRVNHKTGVKSEVRRYTGRYKVDLTDAGDRQIELDIKLNANSLGSDANDEVLFVCEFEERKLLLSESALNDIATSISAYGRMGETRDYFVSGGLDYKIPEYESRGMIALPNNVLPPTLQTIVQRQPVQMKVLQLGEKQEDGTQMVTVDKGTDDGLKMNTPVWLQSKTRKAYKGWVWRLDAKNCGVGIDLVGGGRPKEGDVLTTKNQE